MPRKAREHSLTDYYHVMIRGINKEYVFKTINQKEKLLKLIKEEEQNELIEIGAWCIMDNHVHLLLKASLENMAKAIKIINLKYAAYFNKINERTGPVFGDRYKSESIEDDKYLLGVLRYIHSNPIKAKLVEKIQDYNWSSYKEFIEKNNKIILKRQKDFLLGLFNSNINQFIEFHKQEDNRIFMDTKEDIEKIRFDIAQNIVEDFLQSNGIKEAKELNTKTNHIEELVKDLVEKGELSISQVAEITGFSRSSIFKKVNE